VVVAGPFVYFVGERATGTPTGPELFEGESLLEIWPGPVGSEPGGLTALPDGGGVVFHAWSSEHGRELWVLERAAGRFERLCDFQPGPAPGIPAEATIVFAGDGLYVPAFVDDVGTELVELSMDVVRGDVTCPHFGSSSPDSGRDEPEAGALDAGGSGCRGAGAGFGPVARSLLSLFGVAAAGARRRLRRRALGA